MPAGEAMFEPSVRIWSHKVAIGLVLRTKAYGGKDRTGCLRGSPRACVMTLAGHEAFNQTDFEGMTTQYADSIAWTDHSQGPEVQDATGVHGRLPGRAGRGLPRRSDRRPPLYRLWSNGGVHLHGRRYARRALGPIPATGKEDLPPLCETWHSDLSGRVAALIAGHFARRPAATTAGC
jgi:hypothetical protein